jgi:hypothetical protein
VVVESKPLMQLLLEAVAQVVAVMVGQIIRLEALRLLMVPAVAVVAVMTAHQEPVAQDMPELSS